jgi:hypothetical protein
MASPRLAEVLRYLGALTGTARGADRGDAELLRQFVARRDEDAFAALLERHGTLVLGACRQVLGEEQAEDAFQAVLSCLTSVEVTDARGGTIHFGCRTAQSSSTDWAEPRPGPFRQKVMPIALRPTSM